MKVLNGILKESREYYQNLQKEIKNRMAQISIGSLKKRKISNRIYYYLQYRDKNRIKHRYLGKNYPVKDFLITALSCLKDGTKQLYASQTAVGLESALPRKYSQAAVSSTDRLKVMPSPSRSRSRSNQITKSSFIIPTIVPLLFIPLPDLPGE